MRFFAGILFVIIGYSTVFAPLSEFGQITVWTEKYCKKYHYSANWAMATFYVESRYDVNAVSHKKAGGIGQLLLTTARIFEPCITWEEMMEPEKNIELSVRFMADLNRMYRGDKQKVLDYYFWGNKPHKTKAYYLKVKDAYNKIVGGAV